MAANTPALFGRYAVVGGLATAAHYVLLVVLSEAFGASPGPSATCGALLGAGVAYVGNRRLTFSSRAAHRQALPRFLLVAAGGALLQGAMVAGGTSILGVHYLLAQVLATAVVLIAGFNLNRHWTFA